MNKTMILGLAMFTIAFASVNASADVEYPASDFAPKVLFQDETVSTGPSSSTAAFDPNYPAANFAPKILFQDKEMTHKSGKEVAFDPKYPAAYFKPKVIYP